MSNKNKLKIVTKKYLLMNDTSKLNKPEEHGLENIKLSICPGYYSIIYYNTTGQP